MIRTRSSLENGGLQGFESPRAPLYQREWPAAWRGIDSDIESAPLVGDRSYDRDDVWQLQRRYPALDSKSWHPPNACDLPSKMRYWSPPEGSDLDMRLLKEGRVPPLNRDRFLTFVPDLGGFNNVRLAPRMWWSSRARRGTLSAASPARHLFTACKRSAPRVGGAVAWATREERFSYGGNSGRKVPRLKVDPPQHLSDIVDRARPRKRRAARASVVRLARK